MKPYVGQTVGINTPDGFVIADSFIEKGLRNCKYIETNSGKNVISSYDHLLKTSENGFTKTNDSIFCQMLGRGRRHSGGYANRR